VAITSSYASVGCRGRQKVSTPDVIKSTPPRAKVVLGVHATDKSMAEPSAPRRSPRTMPINQRRREKKVGAAHSRSIDQGTRISIRQCVCVAATGVAAVFAFVSVLTARRSGSRAPIDRKAIVRPPGSCRSPRRRSWLLTAGCLPDHLVCVWNLRL